MSSNSTLIVKFSSQASDQGEVKRLLETILPQIQALFEYVRGGQISFEVIEETETPPDQHYSRNTAFGPLTDSDLMGFGKHKFCKMGDVPASYLLWLFGEPNTKKKYPRHYAYIVQNYDFLKKEAGSNDYD